MRPSRRASALRGMRQTSTLPCARIISFTALKIQCMKYAVFRCDPCETEQLRPAKIFLDIETLSRESDRHSSNLGQVSSNFQTPKIRWQFQNDKALIGKEMAFRRTPVAGALRAYAPWGCLPCTEND